LLTGIKVSDCEPTNMVGESTLWVAKQRSLNWFSIYKDYGLRQSVVFLVFFNGLWSLGQQTPTKTFESRVKRKFPARFGVGGVTNPFGRFTFLSPCKFFFCSPIHPFKAMGNGKPVVPMVIEKDILSRD
jgi:hypothetical protein